jgi:hypothetical protein
MSKFGVEAGAPIKYHLHLWTFFSPTPRGVGKSRLGGELRREEQRYLGRGSARIGTGPSTTCAMVFSHAWSP